MEVILTKTVEKLGGRGEIVHVADGYARNWLLPKGWAIVATRGARRQAEALQRSEQRKEQVRRDAASVERDRVHGRNVTVRARATEAGRLYGSVTARDICMALRETHGLTVEPAQCRIPNEHLRDVGTHTVSFVFYDDIAGEVQVTVKALEVAAATTGRPAELDEDDLEDLTPAAPAPQPIITEGAIED